MNIHNDIGRFKFLAITFLHGISLELNVSIV